MLTQIDIGLFDPNAHYNGFKNRIINGAMMIDQRNAGLVFQFKYQTQLTH
jgi:hypothetical protein